MKWFNRKNTVEEVVTNTEQRFVIEVGHNRNNELIIKKMRVSGDDLEQCITDLQLALQDFKILPAEQWPFLRASSVVYGSDKVQPYGMALCQFIP